MENREEQLSALPKEMAADQVMAEQVMQDAKQSGNQGNLMLGQDGKIMLAADEQMGGSCDKYWWGQNETEVSRLRLLNESSQTLTSTRADGTHGRHCPLAFHPVCSFATSCDTRLPSLRQVRTPHACEPLIGHG